MKIMLCIFAALVLAAVIFGSVLQHRDCAASGGVLVKGQLAYVCVAAAKAAP